MMQILEVVLYGKNEQKRTLAFRPGSVNVITGASTTGKSQVINIIDYCGGSRRCNVARGPIRDKVKWYGLLLATDRGNVFVGRRNPPEGQTSTSEAYLEEATEGLTSPDRIEAGNTTSEAVTAYLRDALGIEEYRFVPPEGYSRRPLEPTFRHALSFCFQKQTEIANDRHLFHDQGDTWEAQAYKDLLPYFLGAVDRDRLAKEQALKLQKSQLRRIQSEIREQDEIAGEGLGRGLRLLEEARQIGIVRSGENPADVDLLRAQLAEASEEWSPEAVPVVERDRVSTLRKRADALAEEVRHLDHQRDAVLSHVGTFEGRVSAAQEQELRLESIGLFEPLDDAKCAICDRALSETGSVVPGMREALTSLSERLERASTTRPRFVDYLADLDAKRSALSANLRDTEAAIETLLRASRDAARLRDLNMRRARVIGRVSLWLETVTARSDTADLQTEAKRLSEVIAVAEKQLTGEDEEERVESILRRVSDEITRYAERLGLEHVVGPEDERNPVSLDIKQLTLVVDKPEGPVVFSEIGSGKNWLGFTVSTHLALHRHFAKRDRPVPNFLVLDQPTQVFYPRENDEEYQGSLAQLADEDREDVNNLFALIFDVVDKAEGKMQVIVLDHANLPDKRFQDAVVERWRGGEALVPVDW